MKNNLYRDFYIPLKMTNKHILRIMKITFASLFIFITGLFATEASSQVAKVSINSENINIQVLINQIEQQTDYLFIFNKNEVDLTRKVSVHAINPLQTSCKTYSRTPILSMPCRETASC